MTIKPLIRRRPVPYCPECGSQMKLREPRPGQDWQPFWGCQNWPDCRGTREILPDGRPEEDDADPVGRWD